MLAYQDVGCVGPVEQEGAPRRDARMERRSHAQDERAHCSQPERHVGEDLGARSVYEGVEE